MDNYWNGNADLNDRYTELFDELVPYSGEADSLEGSLLRAISNLTYDHYNNGSCNARTDMANILVENTNLFNSEIEEQIEYIDRTLREYEREQDRMNVSVGYLEDVKNSDQIERFERALKNVTDAIVRYIDSN